MHYQLGKFTLYANENDVLPDVPPWDENTRYRMPVEIQLGGWDGGTYRGTFYGSTADYREGILPAPAEAVACLVEDVMSAYNAPDEYVEACLPLSTAEQVESIAGLLRFAENHGEALWDEVHSQRALENYEALARYLKEEANSD